MSQPKLRWSIGRTIVVFGAAVALLGQSPARGADKTPITLTSLLNEMASRDIDARFPDPAYTCKQASSHDKRKTNPADPKTWHSNNDYGNSIRTEKNDGREEWVIMEDEGPGTIARMWLPLEKSDDKQIVRFYFDGSPKPTIEAPFNDLISGHGFIKPPFAFISWDETDVRREIGQPGKRQVGSGLYLPIPFAKGCKITLDHKPFYYIVNYRAYAPGTEVQTFTMADFEAAKETIDRVGVELLTDKDEGAATASKKGTLAPGEEIAIDLPAGPAAVRKLQVALSGAHDDQTIRSTVVTGSFDDEAAIWCPMSEFFGAGVRGRAVRDRFREVSGDGTFIARWVMPYQHGGRLGLKNVGKLPVEVSLDVITTPWMWDDRSMHFHANWHCDLGMPTSPRSDWNYIDIKGNGLYVGDTLTVYQPSKQWYGEGDERVYIDGEKIPSHIGTGTEDYYGYAWGMADFFSSPFISVPKRDHGYNDWRDYTTTSRVRELDAIPFESQISHNMEIWNWDQRAKVDYAVGTFWYARPGATCNRQEEPKEAAAPLH